MKVAVHIDSDDDFIFDIDSFRNLSFFDKIYNSEEDAIKAMKSLKITRSSSWETVNFRFSRVKTVEPKDHFFYDFIKLGIESLNKGEDFSIGGNQTLAIYLLG